MYLQGTVVTLIVIAGLCANPDCRAQAYGAVDANFEGQVVDNWHGFERHRFRFEERDAWVVIPKKPMGHGVFSWCMMFPDAFTQRCAAPMLVEKGFYHVFLDVGNSFGSPDAVATLGRFHDFLMKRGFSKRSVLIGISRGGLYAHRYATEFPDRVSVIYGDAPVLDFRSWPGGFGKGKGSLGDWESLKKVYGFSSDQEAKSYTGNPIDTLSVLRAKEISLIYVVGEVDEVVPAAENADIAEKIYREIGGDVKVIRKPNVGHHPHGLDDPTPVVEYISEKTRKMVDSLQK